MNVGGEIRIRITEKEHDAKISVADNGIGMDGETVRRVLDGRLKGKMGIGLFNTDRRLRQIYGKGLQIRSILNEGTTVSFNVPKNGKSD